MNKTTRSHLIIIFFGLIFALIVIISIKTSTGNLHIVYGNGDMEFYGMIQKKIINPNLYSSDIYFNEIYSLWPKYIHKFLSFLIVQFNSAEFVYYVLNILLFSIFFIGNYILSYLIFKNKLTSIIFAILSSYGIPSFFGVNWGITIGVLSIRDFVTALYPWLVFYYLKNSKNFVKLIYLSFVLGVLTNIHLISSSSLIFIFLFSVLISNKISIKLIKKLIVLSTAYFLGAIPYLANAVKVKVSIVPSTIFQYRFGYQYTINSMLFLIGFLFPLCIMYLSYHLHKKTIFKSKIKFLFISTLFFSISSFLISLIIQFIAPFQLMRSTNQLIPLMYLYVSFFINYLLKNTNNVKRIIGLGLFFFLLVPPYTLYNNFLNSNLPNVDLRQDLVKKQDQLILELSTPYNINSIKEISRCVKNKTLISDKILINPFISHSISAYSDRSTTLSYKGGGGLILLRNNLSIEWYNSIQESINLFETNDTSLFLSFANKTESNYILLEKIRNKLNISIICETKDFELYKVPNINQSNLPQ